MDKNRAVSVKFEIFNPTIPSAIHVRPNPITSVAIAPVTICFTFNRKFSFLELTGILLIAIKIIAALAKLAIHNGWNNDIGELPFALFLPTSFTFFTFFTIGVTNFSA
ncbi:Uncharacterised protein [Streptococcus pneumoniae]|nr:Uncharacterised protein [Streptococcus pneumoniae]CJI92775.1 Uncharacterised protein [Streptococcus pneumoniae]CKI99500.1 Uncharacterised protein [Streptococcus pneumoniae]